MTLGHYLQILEKKNVQIENEFGFWGFPSALINRKILIIITFYLHQNGAKQLIT